MKPEHESGREDLQEGDRALLAAYRQASGDMPSEAVDAAVLAAARREVGAGPRSAGRFRLGPWKLPLAMAATVVMSTTVVFMAMREQSLDQLAAPPAPEAARQAPVIAAEKKSRVGEEQDAGAPDRIVQHPPGAAAKEDIHQGEVARAKEAGNLAIERTSTVAAQEKEAVPMQAPKPSMLRSAPPAGGSSMVTAEEDRRVAPEPADVPRPATTSSAPMPAPARPSEPDTSMGPAETPAAPPAAADAVTRGSKTPKMEAASRVDALAARQEKRERAQRDAAVPDVGAAAGVASAEAQAAKRERAQRDTTVPDAAAAAGAAPADVQDARIERIRRLLREGRRAEARLLLSEWRRERPDQALPPDLVELAREGSPESR